MGRYVVASEFLARYGQSSAYSHPHIESHFIFYAENELDALLCQYFPTPFSSNNITVKDLATDLTYLRTGDLKFTDAKLRKEALMKKIDGIIVGDICMVLISGDTLISTGEAVYNSSASYHPTFGMGDVEDYLVDSSQTYAEYLDRHP